MKLEDGNRYAVAPETQVMTRLQRLSIRPSFFLLFLAAAFAAGALADRLGWLSGSAGPAAARGADLRPYWETWRLVRDHYVDRAAIQPQRMVRGSIAGLVASLGDVGHTTYLTPEELDQLASGLEGQLQGIGAGLTFHNGRPTILYTVPGSPAEAAGLRPGDVLLRVDGKDVGDLPVERIARRIRGPAGSTVRLRVERKGEPREVTVTRAEVHVPSVVWHLLPGTAVAHLAIRSFGEQAHAELQAALRQARTAGARALLLDVRGNPGGLKEQAVAVTSEFLSGGTVFLEEDARGHRTAVPVAPGGTATDLPVAVLIDQGTASSAEIFAGALQDHGRGPLVGTRTFGTGTVLQAFELSDGSAVLLAVARWLTPRGREIWHHGIAPDVEVTLPDPADVLMPETEPGLSAADLAHSRDRQLLKALQLVQDRLPPPPGQPANPPP